MESLRLVLPKMDNFFDPRPPLKESKSTAHSLRFRSGEFQIKVKEKEPEINENEEILNEPKINIKSEYSLDASAIVDNIISGKNFKSEDPQLIEQVIFEIKARINDSNKELITLRVKELEEMKEDAMKIEFQREELEFLQLEIGFAQTDYNIFKHKMLAKETDLIDRLKEQIESVKEKQAEELRNASEESKEKLIEKHKKEIENAESLAEERIKEFHKFIEAELKPYKSKLKGLKTQQELAKDKDSLWKAKHPAQAKTKDKGAKIIKPK